MSTKNETKIDNSELSAGRDIELIGGDKYEVSVTPPSPDADLNQLENSLKQNRISFETDEKNLINLLLEGKSLDDCEVDATIKNLFSSIRSIELLIPAIKLRGGNAAYTSKDSGTPTKRINAIINKGSRLYEEKQERIRIERERSEAENRFALHLIFIISVVVVLLSIFIAAFV